ncbi:pyrroline-5-carboxylate reductase [Xylophilus sp. ASV27]|uniref:pyrroline-5-carboxylate reductase n=1 Tax=Xylophilus sp. ASV27 TaxID=2795129 RepID=UPI0018ED0602|nr:pyrroline-5-carboxylate reductase [Xylophilus sp. ASV27]
MTTAAAPSTALQHQSIAFIGGGNMASALIGGLRRQGLPAARIRVLEPFEATRAQLLAQHGVAAQATADAALGECALLVWAVKPQVLREAAQAVAPFAAQALHLSVAAGIRSDSIAGWLGSQRIVRAMPNTPALVGRGMTGLFARGAVSAADRALVDAVIAPTGQALWLEAEAQLDAVTALSGSGPAYVFYFIEAMVQAGTGMGLSAAQAQQLATATFAGAATLAAQSDEPPAVLRERVTSKGGTTHAALAALETAGVKAAFVGAMEAARARAAELGDEFGRG